MEKKLEIEKSMKTSVLMSVYKNDRAEYLRLALESIYVKQKQKPDEIVVVFDGPLNDGLYAVLDEFKRGKEDIVKYIPLGENKGLGEALRVGTNSCRGEYIFRMDSDDISYEERFEEQYRYMESHPDIDVLGARISEFKEDPYSEKLRQKVCPTNHEDIVRMAKKRNPINHMTVCLRRSSLMKAGGYRPLNYLEDYLLWLKMMCMGFKFANLERPLVYMRVGNGMSIRRSSKDLINGWTKLQEVMLDNGMINRWQAINNKIFIRLFVHTPVWAKELLYKFVLRKK